ncbi:MAG: molybdenum cofactor guanylyltransferase [Devosia sp.]
MSLPHAVIIAGGKGERLGGVRKADLRIGGVRLVDRVASALGKLASPLMISTGSRSDWRGLRDGALAVADLEGPVGGPLAGLAAAIASLRLRGVHDGLLVSVAVDTPFLPPDFVSRMSGGLGDAPAAYAVWGEQFYPPNAIWRIEALANLPGRVRQDSAPRSLKALQQELVARREDWTSRHSENPFANVNTVADLVALGRIARNGGPSPLIHTPGN